MKKAILALATLSLSHLAMAQNKHNYAPNIVRFYPVNAFVYGGVGVGLGYERILSKDGKIGFNIPVHLGIKNSDNYYNNPYNNRSDISVLVNPGIKFYPAGQRKVTYALGASLFMLAGSENYTQYDNGFYREVRRNQFRSGIMINNSVQFNIGQKFNLGMEAGIGPSYINQMKESNFTYNDGIQVMGQFAFHLGFRF